MAITVILLVATGCGGRTVERELSRAYDLAVRLPLAERTQEIETLDLGSRASSTYLISGWSRRERRRARPAGFRWSDGAESVVRFPLLVPRELTLEFRCRPFGDPGARPQTVTVAVNGDEVGRVQLEPGPTDYRLPLPAASLVAGENRLSFRYAWTRPPRSGSARDRRRLAVAWYGLRLSGVRPPAEPRAEGTVLHLPYGTQLDYYLALDPGSVLELDGWSGSGDAHGWLEVVFQAEGGEEKRLARLEGGGREEEIILPGDGRRLARLGLRAVSADGPPLAAAGIALESPAIWSPTAGVSATLAPARPQSPPAGEPGGRRANVVVYLVDTLRSDRLGCYGHPVAVSPRLDAFAREAILFEKAIAQSSWTRSAVASILTGLWPATHGANLRRDRLSVDAWTLAEILDAAGYATAAFVGNPNVSGTFGFAQGFDHFDFLRRRNGAREIGERAVRWLEELGDEAPFFIYIHTVEPHDPYSPPPAFRERFAATISEEFGRESGRVLRELRLGDRPVTREIIEDLTALYDAEIAANDEQFGLLLDALEELGLYGDSLIVFVSDHGEEFYEHGGWTHGHTLLTEVVDVPLVVRLPGIAGGRRISEPVQHIDLLPTILDYLGLELPPVEGRSLLPMLVEGSREEDGAPIFSYLHLDQAGGRTGAVNSRASIVAGEWKLVERLGPAGPGRRALYRWRRDPGETENLAALHPVRAGYLAALIRERLLATTSRLQPEEAIIDEELAESLRALGYIP